MMEELEKDAERGREDREALHAWATLEDDGSESGPAPVENPPCGVCQGKEFYEKWRADLELFAPEKTA